MIDAGSIHELIETYKKHGWILRRVLLSAAAGEALGDGKMGLFGDVPVQDSDIDAAWFSRPPKPGGVAWEIRYLGDIPYALLERADENDPQFESILSGVETRLRDAIAAKRTA
jgi:hypothetical protein